MIDSMEKIGEGDPVTSPLSASELRKDSYCGIDSSPNPNPTLVFVFFFFSTDVY